MASHDYRIFVRKKMFDLTAQQYYCTTPSIVVILSVVEIVMASNAAMCKTEYNGLETDAAVEKLIVLPVAETAHAGDCGLPGPHGVIPTPDSAECQT
jgi:hypothetical protein